MWGNLLCSINIYVLSCGCDDDSFPVRMGVSFLPERWRDLTANELEPQQRRPLAFTGGVCVGGGLSAVLSGLCRVSFDEL